MKRGKKLMAAVSGVQTVFTTAGSARTAFKGLPYKYFVIDGGAIKSEKTY